MSRTKVRFGEVVQNVNESIQPGKSHSFNRVIGLEHLDSGDPVLHRWDDLEDLHDGTSFRKVFRKGHVLFGKRRAYQRKVAVAPFDGICSGDILVFSPADDRVLPEFLLYVVQSDAFFSHALQTSSGSLSPRTRWEDLSQYEFELPSLEEQARLTELMVALDAHIEHLRVAEFNLISYRTAWFEKRLSDVEGDWYRGSLRDFAYLNPRGTKLDETSPFVPMDAVEVGRRYVTRFELAGSRTGCRAIAGDVLFARISPCLENGKIAQVPPDVQQCGGSTEFIVVRESETVLADFLFSWLSRRAIRSAAEDLMIGTTGRQRLSAKDLGSMPMELPPREVQVEIVKTLDSLDLALEKVERAISSCLDARESILNSELS